VTELRTPLDFIFVYVTRSKTKRIIIIAIPDREKETGHLAVNFKSVINTIIISPRRWGKSSLVEKAAGIAVSSI